MARNSGNDVHGSFFHLTYAGFQKGSIALRHYLLLTTARLGGLAVRSWRDASSADRHWEWAYRSTSASHACLSPFLARVTMSVIG